MIRTLSKFIWAFRGISTLALVGKSGSGKSFRARLIMEKYAIDLLIDDGLLIREDKIVAGRSAKRATDYMMAVHTAIFNEQDHRDEVRQAVHNEHFKRILVLGTSDKMVNKIATALEIPLPKKIIRIEDIATTKEIETAINFRTHHGSHVVPVPAIEVRKNFPRMIVDSLHVILSKRPNSLHRSKKFEKSVVRPEFSKKGTIQITRSALSQMVFHCVQEFDPQLRISKITLRDSHEGYELDIYVEVPHGQQVTGTLPKLQNYTSLHIERYTGIIIKELNIIIDTFNKR